VFKPALDYQDMVAGGKEQRREHDFFPVAVEKAAEEEAAEDMQWIKVPAHHDFKAAYFRGLRGAIFLMDAGNVARVKRVLGRKEKKWSHVLAYEFAYLAVGVNRKTLAPAQLYARINAVFYFFADKVDGESKKSLFNTVAKRKAHVMLKMVSDGFFVRSTWYCPLHLENQWRRSPNDGS
jgi:hypothetical protein